MGLITATIKNLTTGKTMDPLFELMSLDITREANRIPLAELMLLDGDPVMQEFSISDSNFFSPGNKISISVREGNKANLKVFVGIVLKQRIKATRGESYLTVELADKAYSLTTSRKSKVFRKKDDTAVFKEIISKGKLKSGVIAKTTVKHPELVQYHCTDWDFLLSRADVNGLVVFVENGQVHVKKPALSGGPAATITFGIDEIFDLEIEADGREQVQAAQAQAYDIKEQVLISPPKKGKAPALHPGAFKGEKIGKEIGAAEYGLVSGIATLPAEMTAWANAKMIKNSLGLIKGRITIAGQMKLQPGKLVALKGIGKGFNGKAYVTGIRHQINKESWTSDVQFGLDAEWFAGREGINEPIASGLLPGVHGLQVGIVDKFEADPAGEFRVKVQLPAINQPDNKVWARYAFPDAGKERGVVFWPEKGDEVVVGFFNGDPRQPVVLGSLFSSKAHPPPPTNKPDAKNNLKGIYSRKGVAIVFDDENNQISIMSDVKDAKQRIFMDNKKGVVKIIDEVTKNEISYSKGGIIIKCAKNLKMDIGGDLEINAKGKIKIKGSKTDII